MTIEQIRRLYQSEPFQPFEFCLADGRRYFVPTRELLLAPPNGRTVAVYQAADEAIHILDLLLVTEVRVPTNSNGTAVE